MPTVVQSVTGTASNTTGVLDLTFPDPTTSGNTILVFAGSVSGAYPSAATCTIGGVTDHFAQSGPASVSGTFYGGTGVPLAIATWADPGCAGGQTAIAASHYASAGFYYNAGVALANRLAHESAAQRRPGASPAPTEAQVEPAETVGAALHPFDVARQDAVFVLQRYKKRAAFQRSARERGKFIG